MRKCICKTWACLFLPIYTILSTCLLYMANVCFGCVVCVSLSFSVLIWVPGAACCSYILQWDLWAVLSSCYSSVCRELSSWNRTLILSESWSSQTNTVCQPNSTNDCSASGITVCVTSCLLTSCSEWTSSQCNVVSLYCAWPGSYPDYVSALLYIWLNSEC